MQINEPRETADAAPEGAAGEQETDFRAHSERPGGLHGNSLRSVCCSVCVCAVCVYMFWVVVPSLLVCTVVCNMVCALYVVVFCVCVFCFGIHLLPVRQSVTVDDRE